MSCVSIRFIIVIKPHPVLSSAGSGGFPLHFPVFELVLYFFALNNGGLLAFGGGSFSGDENATETPFILIPFWLHFSLFDEAYKNAVSVSLLVLRSCWILSLSFTLSSKFSFAKTPFRLHFRYPCLADTYILLK